VYKACHGNRCGYGAMVLIMVEQIFITGSDPDAQELPLQKTVYVIQLPIPGREDTFAEVKWGCALRILVLKITTQRHSCNNITCDLLQKNCRIKPICK
jgi:hypothetical protein